MNSLTLRILFILLLPAVSTSAQEKDSSAIKHIIGIHFGLNQIKEENLHSKVSTGTISQLSYGFEKRNVRWHQFHFDISYSRLKTELEDLSKSLNLKFNLDYSRNYPVIQKNNFKYYIGPEGRIAYSASYFPNWDDSHLYWADYLSVGVRNILAIQFKNKNEWVNSVSFPLFSIFSRPELYRLYKIDETSIDGISENLNSDVTAAHLTNVFYVRFDSEYRFPVFKNKTEAFTYSFEWLRVKHDNSNRFQQLSHQIGIKLFL